ncbi:hypothetical protein Q8A67_007579 [Cirrhinus molitorella]|uniref:Uncharacterized protein n=1 Tax=Cirrhinus molitorella TaxID=172907 RepID=A0AA88Q002_9TELE|nr:hypothetical protein Q8A67_007579 [Cirrhinus molitorella]
MLFSSVVSRKSVFYRQDIWAGQTSGKLENSLCRGDKKARAPLTSDKEVYHDLRSCSSTPPLSVFCVLFIPHSEDCLARIEDQNSAFMDIKSWIFWHFFIGLEQLGHPSRKSSANQKKNLYMKYSSSLHPIGTIF